MKINFTKAHFDKLQQLASWALFNNKIVLNRLGGELNIYELLHTTTINSLNTIRLNLGKEIEKLESVDEWVNTSSNQTKLEETKTLKELVNYIIGYKRYLIEVEENARRKRELTAKLAEMKEATKTPEEKIKEVEAELASIESTDF